ncbi:MAG: uroporphyrinogen decarboxylase family protein [Spirochaetales bacterium]|uniref:Uroporphyrinogen decarboxylase family protein n=1 Tax=Candidatus Thalassospirochaeta sargassi TaxID=3119039 RepID=A0AAJ1IEL9_9SPIO|nr:uroporphyrinogen decarboxylase family protein [Spirochaetales bacterium]
MDSYSGLKFEEAGLSRENPVKFFIRTFETEKAVRLHYHSSLEINICRGVDGVIRLGERSIELREDCLIMLPPETPHSYRFSACSGTVEVCHIMLDTFPGAVEAMGGRLGLRILPIDDCPAAAVNRFYSISEARDRAEQYGQLLLFISALANEGNSGFISGNSFLRTVIDYAEKHYSHKISLDDISSAVGVSRYHFSRKFKEHTGETDGIHDIWPATGAKMFEVDHLTDIKSLRAATMGKTTLLGNLDTALLCNGTPAEVEADAKDLIEFMMPESGFILSSGCSMSGNSSKELLHVLVESAKKYGVYK